MDEKEIPEFGDNFLETINANFEAGGGTIQFCDEDVKMVVVEGKKSYFYATGIANALLGYKRATDALKHVFKDYLITWQELKEQTNVRFSNMQGASVWAQEEGFYQLLITAKPTKKLSKKSLEKFQRWAFDLMTEIRKCGARELRTELTKKNEKLAQKNAELRQIVDKIKKLGEENEEVKKQLIRHEVERKTMEERISHTEATINHNKRRISRLEDDIGQVIPFRSQKAASQRQEKLVIVKVLSVKTPLLIKEQEQQWNGEPDLYAELLLLNDVDLSPKQQKILSQFVKNTEVYRQGWHFRIIRGQDHYIQKTMTRLKQQFDISIFHQKKDASSVICWVENKKNLHIQQHNPKYCWIKLKTNEQKFKQALKDLNTKQWTVNGFYYGNNN